MSIHADCGGPGFEMKEPAVNIVDLSADGLAEELEVGALSEGFVHELTVTCARSTEKTSSPLKPPISLEQDSHSPMNRRHFLILASAVPLAARALPFDPNVISRLSLDGKPRSLSIRQGADVWLGYDLERATVIKIWQAPAGKPGLIKAGFATRSAGEAWFTDPTEDSWQLRRGGQPLSVKVRYLGCTHRDDHIDLRWELQHEKGVLKLHERIPLEAAPAADRVVRELRVESLAEGEELLPPAAMRKAWRITHASITASLTGTAIHRLTLP